MFHQKAAVLPGQRPSDTTAPITATIAPNTTTGTITWDSSQATNPSEHGVQATAQIHDHYGTTATFDSTWKSNDGRPGDDIIAALQLKSFTFDGSIPLRYQASANPAPNPDPALVPSPLWAYDQNGNKTSDFTTMAYTQNTAIPFTITLYPLTGSATTGFTLDLTAKPTATNEAALALYQTGATPQPFSGAASLTSKVALYKEVNAYQTIIADLRFWVQFANSTKNWAVISRYADAGHQYGNTLYALVSNPSAPMSQPWVSVLAYACQYAAGTSDATTATTALTNGLYNNGHYNGGVGGNTGPFVDGQEDFYPSRFIAAGLYGQCDDFADFLCCMSTGIGALPLQPQRSASVAEYNNGNGSSFTTNPITWSPTQVTPPATSAGSPVTWTYHQWTTSNVFDGCLRFNGTVSPLNMSLPDYFNNLVATTLHSNTQMDWDPQTLTLNVK